MERKERRGDDDRKGRGEFHELNNEREYAPLWRTRRSASFERAAIVIFLIEHKQ